MGKFNSTIMTKTLVVVSKYNEDVDWVKNIKHDYIVYDKSSTPIEGSIPLRNIGRESETLLYYIITNYKNLPDLTIFLQGDPRSNPISYTYEQVIEEINKEHPYSLETILTGNGRIFINDYWLKTCATLNRKLFPETDGYVEYSPGVQYVIPKDVILNRPVELYETLHNEVLKFGNSELQNNLECLYRGIDAWTLEIVWGSIFNVDLKLDANYKRNILDEN